MANTNALMCFAFGVAQSAGAELTFSLVKNAADGLHEMSLGPVLVIIGYDNEDDIFTKALGKRDMMRGEMME